MDLLSMKSLLFLISLIGCCAGHALPDGPVDGVLGKNVTFKTLLDLKQPAIAIIWNFNNGEDLVPIMTVTPTTDKAGDGYKGRVFINKANGFLTLTSLQAKDSGDYSISVVMATGGTESGETQLRVLVPVSELAIKSSVAEAIEHNTTVVLTCSAKGSFLKFSWTNGTVPIVADGKRVTLSDPEPEREDVATKLSSTLTINKVLRWELMGPIYCIASNKLETERSAPFNLSVSYGPDRTSVEPITPTDFKKGSNISRTCKAVDSKPPATITWYHDGAVVKTTDGRLVLNNIQLAQSGKYHCVAFNPKTLRSVESSKSAITVLEAISGSKITAPTATLIAGNQTAILSCQATAGNVTTRAWLKDGKPLVPSGRVVLSADGSTLTMKPVQKEDNGEYKCQLSNKLSTDSVSYKMVVNFGPEPVKVTGEDEVEVTDPVSIKCSAMSVPPAKYSWKFNGTMTTVTTAEYTIDKAVYKNTGSYTCIAHNAITGITQESKHNLSVREEGALEEAGLSDGAIAGIIIGVLVAVAAAIAAVIYLRRKKTVESPY